ncbi:TPA: YqgQ family protein [Streptococcus suis]|nr:YqgQ family protein [Streptococcus suis]HEL2259457.1 YqgQ family protein [Streptococcus suis]
MKRLYDVQQLLKRFGIIIYMGNRLYDIEMMQIELNRVYQAGVLDRLEYMESELVLRREHRLELEYQKSRENE